MCLAKPALYCKIHHFVIQHPTLNTQLPMLPTLSFNRPSFTQCHGIFRVLQQKKLSHKMRNVYYIYTNGTYCKIFSEIQFSDY
jgi:hypothetical protein